jgi:NodT family efflux transporter outer membrane factor (OMF) lipoprotein
MLIRSRITTRLVPLIVLALPCACAVLPDTTPSISPKTVGSYATQQSYSGQETAWPRDDWWKAWNDPALDGLIAEALAGQPTVAMAMARLSQAEAQAELAGAPAYPSLSVGGDLAEQRLSQNYLYRPGTVPKYWRSYPQATANLAWDPDFWGKNRSALAAATSEAEAARADVAQARLVLSASVAASWAELARLFATHDTDAAAVKVRQETVELMRQRHANGLENEIAVKRAESRLAAARGALKADEEQIALQRNAIAHLLGAGPDRGLILPRPHLDLSRAPGLPPQLALELLGRRPDVVAARLRVEAGESAIDRAKAAFYPNVNLSALIGFQSLSLTDFAKHGSMFGSVGPALSLPIFDGGTLRGQLHGAWADRDLAVADYDRTLSTALREVADAAVGLKAIGGRLSEAEAANHAAEEAASRMRHRYEGGLATALDALTAEDEMLASRHPVDDLRSRSFALDATLAMALGGGWRLTAN